jgi:hypothetical protein
MSLAWRNFVKALAYSAALGAILLASPGAALAYGPPPPPGPPNPGGYNCVVISRQADPFATTIIGPLRVGELLVEVRVPAGTFDSPVRVTITDPYSPAGLCQTHPRFFGTAFRGYRLIGGVGILVGLPAVAFGQYPKAVKVSLEPYINVHDFQSEDIASARGGLIEQVSGARSHRPITLSADDSPEYFVLVRGLRARHPHAVAHQLRAAALPASQLAAAALLPAGSPLPGIGVFLVQDSGGSLLSSGHAAAAGT